MSPLAHTSGKVSQFLLILANPDVASSSSTDSLGRSISNSESNSDTASRDSKSSTSSLTNHGERSSSKRKADAARQAQSDGKSFTAYDGQKSMSSNSSRRDILESLRDKAHEKRCEDPANYNNRFKYVIVNVNVNADMCIRMEVFTDDKYVQRFHHLLISSSPLVIRISIPGTKATGSSTQLRTRLQMPLLVRTTAPVASPTMTPMASLRTNWKAPPTTISDRITHPRTIDGRMAPRI